MKKSILDLVKMKEVKEKVTWVVAYDYSTASLAEQAGLDMILVGDSVGMIIYGYPSTMPVTMEQMLYHTEAVRRAAPNTFVVGDMPFMSYQKSVESAIENAGKFYRLGVDAIKLEGGKRVAPQIEGIVDSGMVVIGHIGLTPQSSSQMGGFKVQGNTQESAEILVDDAKAVERAGASILLVEGVPAETGKIITERLSIPVYGIGAGQYVDGQLLLSSDLLGTFEGFKPKFAKRYVNISEQIKKAFMEYASEVRSGVFPTAEYCYKMKKEG
jgi:3-methyl-2-oxobutanoate hydroxymethyltransferase